MVAVERAQDPHLRALARLIVANQQGETEIFGQWWRSWFDGDLPPATAADHAAMPGMLPPGAIEALRQAEAAEFDARFIALMSFHHQGAIAMADEAIREAGALRLRLMSHAIRHGQRGEIELMQGRQGIAAVRSAVANLLRPAGAVTADGMLGRTAAAAGAPHQH
jgi:uncharacterized protein (DUF305 family)